MTETISSKLSLADRLSVISVVCDSQFLSEEERRLMGLRRTVGTVTDTHLKNTGSSKSALSQYKASYIFLCLVMVLILPILDDLFDQHSLPNGK